MALVDDHAHPQHGHADSHHEESFLRKYVFSQDHKVIGIQYGFTALVFLLFGFTLMMMMRWQLAYPGQADAAPRRAAGPGQCAGGIMLPEFYNQLGAMHGTIMVFLGVVPLAVGAFGNYVVPLQIGAPDMAFPKLNMASYWVYFCGGVVMLASFFMPGGAAQSGWTSYPPLADIAPSGQTMWLVGMVFLITSSLLGADQLHRHDHPAARAGPHLDAPAVLRLGAVRDLVPAAARVPAARSGGRAAVDGPPGGHQLLPAERPRGLRPAR